MYLALCPEDESRRRLSDAMLVDSFHVDLVVGVGLQVFQDVRRLELQ